jgi:MFS family permease
VGAAGNRGASGPAWRRFCTGYALSAVGQSMAAVPVLVLVHERTSSLGWMAVVAAARLVPYLLVSPVAGVLADRVDRSRLLRAAHAVRAAGLLTLAAAAAAGAPAGLLVGLSFVVTACGTPCFPAALAGLRHVIEPSELDRATGMVSTLETAAFLAGPAAGGLLVAMTSPTTALLTDALVLVVALGLVPNGLGGGRSGWRSARLLDDLVAGSRLVAARPPVRRCLVVAVVVNVIGGMVSVLVVPMATTQLGTGAAGVGLLTAAFGGGGLAGAGLATLRSGWSPVLTIALAGVPLAVAAPAGRTALVLPLLAVAGASATVVEVRMIMRIQHVTPDVSVARVFGLFDAAVVAAVALGAALAPVAVALVGLPATLLLTGLALPLPAARALGAGAGRSLRSLA